MSMVTTFVSIIMVIAHIAGSTVMYILVMSGRAYRSMIMIVPVIRHRLTIHAHMNWWLMVIFGRYVSLTIDTDPTRRSAMIG